MNGAGKQSANNIPLHQVVGGGDLLNILSGRPQLRRAWPTPIFGAANTIGVAR